MNLFNRQGMLAFFLIVGWVTPVIAELTVIYDNGQTRSLLPLLSPLLAEDEQFNDAAPSIHQKLPSKPLLGPAEIRNLLPIRSPGLHPGDIGDRQLNSDILTRLAKGNPRPFFLVGSDPLSLQWLTTNLETLKSLGAVGMLVQAQTEADVERISRAAKGLSMTLGSGTDLGAALGVDRYPVLISRKGLLQ